MTSSLDYDARLRAKLRSAYTHANTRWGQGNRLKENSSRPRPVTLATIKKGQRAAMNYIAIAQLAMKLLSNKELLDRVKAIVPLPPPPRQPATGYKQGSVAWLQDALNQIDDADLEADGDYGELTRAAVEEYQRSVEGLEADGWAGPLTVASIVEDLEERARA